MKDLVIASLFDGATDAEGHVVTLKELSRWAQQLDAAAREVGDRQGPVTDPKIIERIERARETLSAITQLSKQLSRLLSRAVLR